MNKKKLIIIGWIADVICLYLSIFLPKNEVIYDITFIVFIATFTIIPMLLLIWGLFEEHKENTTSFKPLQLLPIGGLLLLELASFVKFNQALIAEALSQWYVVVIVVVCLQVAFMGILFACKYTFRKQALLTILSLLTHFGFIYFAIQISFTYNNLW